MVAAVIERPIVSSVLGTPESVHSAALAELSTPSAAVVKEFVGARTERSNTLAISQAVSTFDLSLQEGEKVLQNLAQAIRLAITGKENTLTSESGGQVSLGDVYSMVDVVGKGKDAKIVIQHRDVAGKGMLGPVWESIKWGLQNPIKCFSMMVLGLEANPEVVHLNQLQSILARLGALGYFSPNGGANTYHPENFKFGSDVFWKNLTIAAAGK